MILGQEGATTGVHLDITQDSVDVESSEGEDLREFTVFELGFQEQDFAFSSANVSVACADIASLVDHEASLVHIDVLASVIFANKQLDTAVVVPIEDPHDLLELKGLPIVVEELRH